MVVVVGVVVGSSSSSNNDKAMVVVRIAEMKGSLETSNRLIVDLSRTGDGLCLEMESGMCYARMRAENECFQQSESSRGGRRGQQQQQDRIRRFQR